MTYEAAEALQREIDEALRVYGDPSISRIELGRGSEVTDLTQCADVRIHKENTDQERTFSICTATFLKDVLIDRIWKKEDHPRPDLSDIYTTGRPLIVVREIDSDTIVRSVVRYLELEEGRKNPWIPPNFRRIQEGLQ